MRERIKINDNLLALACQNEVLIYEDIKAIGYTDYGIRALREQNCLSLVKRGLYKWTNASVIKEYALKNKNDINNIKGALRYNPDDFELLQIILIYYLNNNDYASFYTYLSYLQKIDYALYCIYLILLSYFYLIPINQEDILKAQDFIKINIIDKYTSFNGKFSLAIYDITKGQYADAYAYFKKQDDIVIKILLEKIIFMAEEEQIVLLKLIKSNQYSLAFSYFSNNKIGLTLTPYNEAVLKLLKILNDNEPIINNENDTTNDLYDLIASGDYIKAFFQAKKAFASDDILRCLLESICSILGKEIPINNLGKLAQKKDFAALFKEIRRYLCFHKKEEYYDFIISYITYFNIIEDNNDYEYLPLMLTKIVEESYIADIDYYMKCFKQSIDKSDATSGLVLYHLIINAISLGHRFVDLNFLVEKLYSIDIEKADTPLLKKVAELSGYDISEKPLEYKDYLKNNTLKVDIKKLIQDVLENKSLVLIRSKDAYDNIFLIASRYKNISMEVLTASSGSYYVIRYRSYLIKENKEALLNEAESHFKNGELEKAITNYLLLISSEEDINLDYVNKIAMSMLYLKNMKGAKSYYLLASLIAWGKHLANPYQEIYDSVCEKRGKEMKKINKENNDYNSFLNHIKNEEYEKAYGVLKKFDHNNGGYKLLLFMMSFIIQLDDEDVMEVKNYEEADLFFDEQNPFMKEIASLIYQGLYLKAYNRVQKNFNSNNILLVIVRRLVFKIMYMQKEKKEAFNDLIKAKDYPEALKLLQEKERKSPLTIQEETSLQLLTDIVNAPEEYIINGQFGVSKNIFSAILFRCYFSAFAFVEERDTKGMICDIDSTYELLSEVLDIIDKQDKNRITPELIIKSSSNLGNFFKLLKDYLQAHEKDEYYKVIVCLVALKNILSNNSDYTYLEDILNRITNDSFTLNPLDYHDSFYKAINDGNYDEALIWFNLIKFSYEIKGEFVDLFPYASFFKTIPSFYRNINGSLVKLFGASGINIDIFPIVKSAEHQSLDENEKAIATKVLSQALQDEIVIIPGASLQLIEEIQYLASAYDDIAPNVIVNDDGYDLVIKYSEPFNMKISVLESMANRYFAKEDYSNALRCYKDAFLHSSFMDLEIIKSICQCAYFIGDTKTIDTFLELGRIITKASGMEDIFKEPQECLKRG